VLHWRRLVKFLHTLGSAGLIGATLALAVVLIQAPATISAQGYAPLLDALATISIWVIAPSLVLTIVTGLLAMLANRAYMDVGWVWAKLATGLLMFQAGLHMLGPIQAAAREGAGNAEAAGASPLLEIEINIVWVLLGVAVANIALGVWRPRFPKYPVGN
jgi:uncharacterized membrane protein